MDSRLNSFQVETRARVEQLLNSRQIPATFEVGGGPKEFGIKIKVLQFESWIYPDGADVGGNGVDKRFETYDYDSLDQLQQDYLQFLDQLLNSIS